MKSCQSRLATAALLSLVSAVLAGCGQTGPLYMPNDQAARERYDPGNAYGLPPINRHEADEQKQQEHAQGHTHRHHHGHSQAAQTLPAQNASATEEAVHGTGVPADNTSSESGITSAAAGAGATQATSGTSSSSKGTVPQSASATPRQAKTPAASRTTHEDNSSTDNQPASTTSSASSSDTSPWQGMQFTPYSASSEGSGLNIQSGTPNSQ